MSRPKKMTQMESDIGLTVEEYEAFHAAQRQRVFERYARHGFVLPRKDEREEDCEVEES